MSASSAAELIHCSSDDGIAEIVLDHPPVNAFSRTMWQAMRAAMDRISADESVRVAILTAAGTRAFSAGADVKEAAGLSPDEEAARRELVSGGLRQLASLAVPVVCAVNGPAVGGGLNIATLCDLRIASASAVFSLPEIDHGRVGGGGSFLRRIGVPGGTIHRMLYTGCRLDARQALANHLVDEVVAPDRLMDRARELAEGIAAKPRAALVQMKAAIRASQSSWFDGYIAAERSRAEPDRIGRQE